MENPLCHKIVFLGNSAVGKTSIISQYIFNSCVSDHQSTIGIDYFTKTVLVDDKSIRLLIWDTAGQEKFSSQITSYLHNSTISILVYDITQKSSFESMQKWHKTILNSGDPHLVVVGNKVDLESQRQISYEDGEKYSNSIGASFIETSAKTPINISELFIKIAKLPIKTSETENETIKPITIDIKTPKNFEVNNNSCGC